MNGEKNSDGLNKGLETNTERAKNSEIHNASKVSSPKQSVATDKHSDGSESVSDSSSIADPLQQFARKSPGGGPSPRSVSLNPSEASSLTSSRTSATYERGKSISSSLSRKTIHSQGSQKNPLDDMNNAEVIKTVQDLQKTTKHYELENMVFLHFLQKNDPTAAEALESTLKNVQAMHDRASISSRRMTLSRPSRRESSIFGTSSSFIAPTPSAAEKEGPRINLTQKTDLILREMDQINASLKKLNKKCHIVKHKLKAELEEMSIRESEIEDIMTTFEGVFITGTIEKYPQKNPGDKFARFMEECFKTNRTTIDKLRLRTSSLKVQYQKIANQLTQKKLLGENLQEVDFEQLQISNKHLMKKIDQRNLLLLELKKMNGHANLLLSNTKKNLLTKMEDLKEIKETIAFREDLTVKLDDECDRVAIELDKTKAEFDKMKTRNENYKVPEVIEYVKKKAELGMLKKNLKIWARRKQVKDMSLNASVREMKHTTGLNKPDPSWFASPTTFKRLQRGSSIVDNFEFAFERAAKAALKAERAAAKKKKNKRRLH